jgi:predicted ester cyclase
MMLSAFSDNRAVIQDQIGEEDKVFTRLNRSAVHKGTYRGIPVTGKKIRVAIVAINQVKEGRIVESWELLDKLTLLQQ